VFDSKKNIENQINLNADINKIQILSYDYANNVIFNTAKKILKLGL